MGHTLEIVPLGVGSPETIDPDIASTAHYSQQVKRNTYLYTPTSSRYTIFLISVYTSTFHSGCDSLQPS